MKNNTPQKNYSPELPVTPALIIDFPREGKTKDMFSDLAWHILNQGIQSFEIRKSQKGMRLAIRDKNEKLQYLTSYFPYISAIRFFQDCRYFYAGKESELRLYTIKSTPDTGDIYIEEVKNSIFSLEEIVHEKYLGNGIIEYAISQEKSEKSDPIQWKTSFVDIHSCQKYILNGFSFDYQTLFVRDCTTYIVGRSFDAHNYFNHSDTNTKCVVVLSGKYGGWHILGDKFLGDITPVMGIDKKIIGFEGPIQEADGTIKRYQILCREEEWK